MKTFGVQIEKSKRGLDCAWESGGASTNTGRSQIICDLNGNPKK